MKRYKTVDAFIEAADHRQDELVQLRKILLSTGLTEDVKWGAPCYTYQGKNLVGMGSFKSYVGLWFYQGALLEDSKGVLINAQEGRTKAMRQWRFSSKKDIKSGLIKAYVKEAISLVDQGMEIKPERKKALVVSKQLKTAIANNKKAANSWEALTPGKQREYSDYIDDAKRDETKVKRIEKIMPMIIAGIGLNDKYRNC